MRGRCARSAKRQKASGSGRGGTTWSICCVKERSHRTMLSQNLEPTKLSRLLSPQASAEMKADRLKAKAAKRPARSTAPVPEVSHWIASEVTIEDPQAAAGASTI